MSFNASELFVGRHKHSLY